MVEHLLTAQEKTKHLYYWADRRREFAAFKASRSVPFRHHGGYGYPDPEIYALTDRLNEITGVCTVQSCSGHPATPDQGVYPGQLWLRLDERRFSAFLRDVEGWLDELNHGPSKSVPGQREWLASILWGRQDEGPVVDLIFPGLDQEADALANSSQSILEFFGR
jgi:hypothetical protein